MEGCGGVNLKIFYVFPGGVGFWFFWGGLRFLGGGGGVEPPPLGTPLAGRMDILFGHLILHKSEDLSRQLFRCPHGSVWWLPNRICCLLGS